MSATNPNLASLGLDDLLGDASLYRDQNGALFDSLGKPLVCATPEWTRSLRHVLERERPGAWRQAQKYAGRAWGRALALHLDAQLAARSKPALSALPLEACLALLQRAFAANGWGRLSLDLTHAAEHGLVVARLEHSYFVEALSNTNDFVDALPAGVLHAFFEHISGQSLGCEEVACGSRGATQCVFVITAAERVTAIAPSIGRESAEQIIARLAH